MTSQPQGEPTDPPRRDGRDARWAQHRQTRRQQLVEAGLAAIRKHGPTVGMDEIAAEAGTSKTVVYRHLGDRLGMYQAICEAVDAQILHDFRRALGITAEGPDSRALARDPLSPLVAVIDSYLHLVERDPEVYRFVTRRPLVDVPAESDPLVGLTDTIAATLAEIIAGTLTELGRDPSPATTWSHGLVGFVRESADRWLVDPQRPPRAEVVRQLADLAGFGLAGVVAPADTDRARTSRATMPRHEEATHG